MFSRVLPSSEGNIWLPNIQNHPPNSLNCPGTIAIETKGADFLGWFITHIEFVFLKSQWMLVHFVKWIRSLLAYGKKTVSSKSSFTEIWSNGLWNCSLEDILYMKYNLRNTVLWYKIYNSIHIPTNLWQEWNHAPSKNSKHTYIYIYKTDSVEKDSSTKPRRILTWLLFILSLRSSTEHLNLFSTFLVTHIWICLTT